MSIGIFDLSGRIALVTGSSQGIGFAMAGGLARAGAHVVLNGRDPTKLARAAATLREEGLAVSERVFDVTDSAAIDDAVQSIEAEIGPIQILINNAGGVVERIPIRDAGDDLYDTVLDLNARSVFACSRAALPFMEAKGGLMKKGGKVLANSKSQKAKVKEAVDEKVRKFYELRERLDRLDKLTGRGKFVPIAPEANKSAQLQNQRAHPIKNLK